MDRRPRVRQNHRKDGYFSHTLYHIRRRTVKGKPAVSHKFSPPDPCFSALGRPAPACQFRHKFSSKIYVSPP